MTLSHLGQSGFRLRLNGATVYIDPYLSDHVELVEGIEMRRLRPPPILPGQIIDADCVLVSHAHPDHCDPDTLGPIARQCPACRFVCSFEVAAIMLSRMGVDSSRIVIADKEGIELIPGTVIHPVPAAHPDLETDASGRPRYLGFVVEHDGRRLYHAGDGSVHPEIAAALKRRGRIDTALLPVNECNYYRARRGIVGNMSVREAFGYAEEIGAARVIPMHFDMFAPNSVYEDEIEAVYRNLRPRFAMDLPSTDMSW